MSRADRQLHCRLAPLSREEIGRRLEDIADLRMGCFSGFPYLYGNSREQELWYLRTFLDDASAFVVGAWDGDRLVGAATGAPLNGLEGDLASALTSGTAASAIAACGVAPEDVFYNVESVLLAEYRGQGVGRRFFELREARARDLGRRWSAFPAIVRPPDHPARPGGYTPLDAFWAGRGYRKLEGALVQMRWRETGATAATGHELQIWIRDLTHETAEARPD